MLYIAQYYLLIILYKSMTNILNINSCHVVDIAIGESKRMKSLKSDALLRSITLSFELLQYVGYSLSIHVLF